MGLLKILKRPFCNHNFETATFKYQFPNMKVPETFPCQSINGATLQECTKCGKQRMITDSFLMSQQI